MRAEGWRDTIGAAGWDHLLRAAGGDADVAAAVATAMTEIGGRMPSGLRPDVTRDGRVVRLSVDGPAQLTADGLRARLAALGAGFYLLRADQLLRACRGPLLSRLNEILGLYAVECARDGVDEVPPAADFDVFVGASPAAKSRDAVGPTDGAALLRALYADSPVRTAKVDRTHGRHGK